MAVVHLWRFKYQSCLFMHNSYHNNACTHIRKSWLNKPIYKAFFNMQRMHTLQNTNSLRVPSLYCWHTVLFEVPDVFVCGSKCMRKIQSNGNLIRWPISKNEVFSTIPLVDGFLNAWKFVDNEFNESLLPLGQNWTGREIWSVQTSEI